MPDRPLPIPDQLLRALWRVVELSVFMVLIVKDRRVPTWNNPAVTTGQTVPNHSVRASTTPALLPQPTQAT
ncbi:hypothetical protein B7R22_06470 [Subtercola boreus]|uniref:Uncharacterized protein n=1 Tax=Subtercola boreus TaxID=120213 RepID=A0A3E0W0S9_9MICO|nr:hypothetical protein [Subtercola boreus]RFA15590.1 hypothetical protein B7R22_06470 [Subtercola boreus]